MNVLKRASRRILFAAVVILLLMPIIAVRSVIRAGDDSHSCLVTDTPGCMYGLPTFQYQLLLGEMAAHPVPNVRPLAYDLDDLGVSAGYRVIGGATPLYDAPNGNEISVFDTGFNNINVIAIKGDWAQVAPQGWVKAKNLTKADSSTFAGVVIDEPLAYPMGWVLEPTRPSAIPGQKPDPRTLMWERYERVNIFATVTVGDWDWYLVGPGQWLEQRRVARVTTVQKPDGVKGRWIAVDLYEQTLAAYDENDQMVFATVISSGLPKPGFGTNKGLFRIWARLVKDNMTGGYARADYYNLPNVPYVMYFDNAIALHGTYWHDGFGYRRSHGCVNMATTDARWVYEWTNSFYTDAWVYVYATRDAVKPYLASQ